MLYDKCNAQTPPGSPIQIKSSAPQDISPATVGTAAARSSAGRYTYWIGPALPSLSLPPKFCSKAADTSGTNSGGVSSSPPSLSSPPPNNCCEAAGAGRIYSAAASIGVASLGYLASSPSLFTSSLLQRCYEVAGAGSNYSAAGQPTRAASPPPRPHQACHPLPHLLCPPSLSRAAGPRTAGAGPSTATGRAAATAGADRSRSPPRPSPVGDTCDGSHKVPTANCSLYWGGPSLLSASPVDRTGSGAHYGAAATRLIAHFVTTTQEECEAGINGHNLTSFLYRSPRDIAFTSGIKPSSST